MKKSCAFLNHIHRPTRVPVATQRLTQAWKTHCGLILHSPSCHFSRNCMPVPVVVPGVTHQKGNNERTKKYKQTTKNIFSRWQQRPPYCPPLCLSTSFSDEPSIVISSHLGSSYIWLAHLCPLRQHLSLVRPQR